jgi:uncharacterized repeat protein (TIGR03803 family)
MQGKRRLILFVTAFTVVFGFLRIAAPLVAAQEEKTLYNFRRTAGGVPTDSLISDAARNLFGTTLGGGAHLSGTVFRLTPGSGGKWTEKVLHSFNGSDGSKPFAGLIFDMAGNLYGTTTSGGGTGCGGYGCGTVFQLTPGTNDKWTEKVLHSFNGADGYYPSAGLIFDATGNLYGTTSGGGTSSGCNYGCGTVFQLAPGARDTWTETVLHSFSNNGMDGYEPYGGLIFDATGNLYGTTFSGGGTGCGGGGCGTVFQLAPGARGRWTETALHSFNNNGTDGITPQASLILNTTGGLYGTTTSGGEYTFGTVFQLTSSGGKWTEKVLHSFNHTDGYYPSAGLIFDATGNLYGTTWLGGGDGCGGDGCGTVFQLAPGANGTWSETVLHSFQHNKFGWAPVGGLILDSSGDLFGTTSTGGTQGAGTAFEITP